MQVRLLQLGCLRATLVLVCLHTRLGNGLPPLSSTFELLLLTLAVAVLTLLHPVGGLHALGPRGF